MDLNGVRAGLRVCPGGGALFDGHGIVVAILRSQLSFLLRLTLPHGCSTEWSKRYVCEANWASLIACIDDIALS